MARSLWKAYTLVYLVHGVLCDPARPQLSADPGFKDVRLYWRLEGMEEGIAAVFRIKYCENQVFKDLITFGNWLLLVPKKFK